VTPERRADARNWLLLLTFSAALAGLLLWIGLPAALLLGPMAAAILLAVRGVRLQVPSLPFYAAQAIVGCLIAASMTRSIVTTVAGQWWLFLAVTALTLGASSLLGWLLSRWQVLPGTAAIWGSTPGAATAMVLMANAYGADARLVAVMTYTRVVCVAAIAAFLALILSGHAAHAAGAGWLAPLRPIPMAETLAVAAIGAWAAIRLRIPAGALIGPLVLGSVLDIAGLVRFELPTWLLAASYTIVGWRIGLGFNRDTVVAARRALPRILLSIFSLIGFCAFIGFLVSRLVHVDPVTAFLATSPGGMDSVAIIAASSPVNIPFVMALQAVRFVGVLLMGPTLARFVANRQERRGIVTEPADQL
jgi:membrane AbrB-like protein